MFVGLVGKPSAGKSTFFKALTLMEVGIANYPFTTIKPNTGIGFVKIDCVDKDFHCQCNPREGYCVNHKRFVPVQVLDVAGLVPGAHEGKGLGLEFLNDLSQADCLIHVVDISGSLNEKGEPVAKGTYDPANDIRFLEHELDMWYYGIFQKVWKKFSITIKLTKENIAKAIAKQFSGIKVTEAMVQDKMKRLGLMEKPITGWTEEELKTLTRELRKETKPIIIAANKIDVPGAEENYKRLKEQFKDYIIIPCSAEAELALKEANKKGLIEYIPGDDNFVHHHTAELSDKQKHALEFVRREVLHKFQSTGVQQTLNSAVFDLLKYIAIFPGGTKTLVDRDGRRLPDCFLMPSGTTAISFAFHLHTDLGNRFIRAINVKTKMSMKESEPLKHRDVIEIVHDG